MVHNSYSYEINAGVQCLLVAVKCYGDLQVLLIEWHFEELLSFSSCLSNKQLFYTVYWVAYVQHWILCNVFETVLE